MPPSLWFPRIAYRSPLRPVVAAFRSRSRLTGAPWRSPRLSARRSPAPSALCCAGPYAAAVAGRGGAPGATRGRGRSGGGAMGNLFGRKRRSRVTEQDKAVLVSAGSGPPRRRGGGGRCPGPDPTPSLLSN